MNKSAYLPFHRWFILALINLLIVALSGLFLRFYLFHPVPGLEYKFLLHAHSHFAFAGWGFLVLYVALVRSFVPAAAAIAHSRSYRRIFWLAQIAAFGMLFSFPFEGYAVVSISFSSLLVMVSYWFAWRFFKDATIKEDAHLSISFARTALFFLLFSSLGPFAMGPITAMKGEGSPVYYNAIYFYLHFQYNGWFCFGILALFFRWLELKQISYPGRTARLFYFTLAGSCFPAFLLSVLWTQPAAWAYITAGIAGAVQLIALFFLLKIIRAIKLELHAKLHPGAGILMKAAGSLFGLKLFLQLLSAFPLVAAWAYRIHYLIIGYLHLVFLGVITLFLLAYLIQEELILIRPAAVRYGLKCFIAGFLITESLLFGEGAAALLHTFIPHFAILMLLATILLPLGAGLIWIGQLKG